MTAPDAKLVKHATSSVWRRGTHHSLERCDLEQIGWLALLEAQAAGAVPADLGHRTPYLLRRMTGAMIDASRAANRRGTDPVIFDSREADDAAAALPDPAPGPDRAADARLRLRRIMANGSARVCEAVTLMAEHMHARTVAAQMGIGESAAGKLLHRAAALADPQPRPAKPRAEPARNHSIRLTDARWAAYQALGGAQWLAAQIDAAMSSQAQDSA